MAMEARIASNGPWLRFGPETRPAAHNNVSIACVIVILVLAIFLAIPNVGAGNLTLSANAPQEQQSEIVVPLPKGKKIILSDGSFQIVREYYREGDRVRYYSLERSAWEEIPAPMVDWDGTQRAEAEQDAQNKELQKQIAESEKRARFAGMDVDTSFEVRPGTFLPDNVGFYVLDSDKIAALRQERAEMHTEKGRELAKIVTGVPLISSRQDMEILGKRAKLRIPTGDAEFYFRTADKREPRLTLLRAEVNGEKRTVAVINTNIVGQQTFKNREISLLQWDATRGLYRYTVSQALEPGEYAFIEKIAIEQQDQEQSIYVWAFGVDPPENPGTIREKSR